MKPTDTPSQSELIKRLWLLRRETDLNTKEMFKLYERHIAYLKTVVVLLTFDVLFLMVFMLLQKG